METSSSLVYFINDSDVSRVTDVLITLYAKNSTGGADLNLGSIKILPDFSDQSIKDDWFTLTSTTDDAKAGEVHVQLGFKKNGAANVSLYNLETNFD